MFKQKSNEGSLEVLRQNSVHSEIDFLSSSQPVDLSSRIVSDQSISESIDQEDNGGKIILIQSIQSPLHL